VTLPSLAQSSKTIKGAGIDLHFSPYALESVKILEFSQFNRKSTVSVQVIGELADQGTAYWM